MFLNSRIPGNNFFVVAILNYVNRKSFAWTKCLIMLDMHDSNTLIEMCSGKDKITSFQEFLGVESGFIRGPKNL